MNLVISKDNQAVTDSLTVARYFGKEHRHVIDSVRGLIRDITKTEISALGENLANSMFYEDTYEVENNFKKYPMFYMNKDGWTMLVMGYTGKKATEFKLQYMFQFNKMERELKRAQNQLPSPPHDYATALRGLADQVEINERLRAENERLKQSKPMMVEQTELLSETLYTAEEIALSVGCKSARALNKVLNEARILYYQKGLWHLYAPYANRGFKDMSTRRKSQMWTEKGKEFVENKLKKVR